MIQYTCLLRCYMNNYCDDIIKYCDDIIKMIMKSLSMRNGNDLDYYKDINKIFLGLHSL